MDIVRVGIVSEEPDVNSNTRTNYDDKRLYYGWVIEFNWETIHTKHMTNSPTAASPLATAETPSPTAHR